MLLQAAFDFIYARKESQRFSSCRHSLSSKVGFDNLAGLLQSINGLFEQEVAQVMQKSLIFLAFGHLKDSVFLWQRQRMRMLFNWLLWFRV